MNFKKEKRSYYSTADGWRLATFEEAKSGLETIKKEGLLNKWDRARLLDGWISGAGYDFQMGDDFRGCLGYMLLIQTQAAESLTLQQRSAYEDVTLSDFGKEVALFLCVDDWNYEVVYWVLNSWSKSDNFMDLADVREGRIPISDAARFIEVNQTLCDLARKLGDVGGAACERVGKRKYSGLDSVKDVLFGMINFLKHEENSDSCKFHIDDARISLSTEWNYCFSRNIDGDILKSCFPESVEPTWLENSEWNTIEEPFWRFMIDSFAGFVLTVSATLGLTYISDIAESQNNFIIATYILYYLSSERLAIIHAPLAHNCVNSCAEKILRYVAEKDAAGEPERLKQMLQNNPMWRCYDDTQHYHLLNKLLIVVAKINHIGRIKRVVLMNTLLECGAQPGRSYAIGKYKQKTALHYAATLGREEEGIEIAISLFSKCDGRQKKELANAVDERERTALHRASKKCKARMCQLLLDNGATVNAQDQDGKTGLHYALQENGNDDIINVFMRMPDISRVTDLKDKKGYSPLDIAVVNTHIKSVAKLLSKSKQPEDYFSRVDREQLLRHSLLDGYVDIVRKLLENGTKLPDDDEGKTALHLAVMHDDEHCATEMVKIIMQNESHEKKQNLAAKRDKRGKTALHDAASKGYEYLCRDLLKINPDIISIRDRDGRNPLYDVLEGKHKHRALLKFFISVYLDNKGYVDDLIDRSGLTLLHVAASDGETEHVTELLSSEEFKKNYLSRGDFLGQTPLHKAAKRGHTNTVKILLQEGAHPLKERDCDGRTALHYAVLAETDGGKEELVDSLLERCNSEEEKCLLLWASAAGVGTADQNVTNDDLLLKFLVQKKNKNTENLLKMAASMGDIQMAKELITRGYPIQGIRDLALKGNLTTPNKENVQRGRSDYAQGLAALFLNPYLKPPIAVGISGSWGMGKSSLMVQTESILLTTAAQMALLPSSKLSSSAIALPDIKPFVLSKKGKKKYEEIEAWINFKQKINRNIFVNIFVILMDIFFILLGKITCGLKQSDKMENQQENGHNQKQRLEDFLDKYDPKYRKVFKSLAAMDSSDMFTVERKEDQKPQRSRLRTMWDMFHSQFKTNAPQPDANAQQSKADSSGEENVPAVLTVQYNAWKYKNDTEALAGMAVEITKELEGIMTQAQWLSTCWRNTWKKKKFSMLIEFFFPCLLALVLAFSFLWIAWLVFDSDKFKEWVKAKYACPPVAIVIIAWTLTKSVMGVLKPVSTQLMNYVSFPDHTDKLGYQDRVISDITFLKKEIGEKPYWVFIVFAWVFTALALVWRLITELWVTSLLFHPSSLENAMEVPKVSPASGTNLRIIVFVDDLDRCQEAVILQVLSAINLVLAECEISVVLGMDKRLIERAIIKKYGDGKAIKSLKASQELADMYLQKIIQLPLDLPDPSEEQSRKFLKIQLGVFEEGTTNDLKRAEDSGSSMPSESSSRESSVSGDSETEPPALNTTTAEIAITVQEQQVESEIKDLESASSSATNLNDQATNEAPSETNAHTGIKTSSSTILIREMLFVRYSEGEQEAFCFLQPLATECRKLPREWKRLVNYHRLVWYIFFVSKEAKDLAGWQLQLITWIFICWEWQDNMNLIIEKWNNLGVLKTSDSNGPSLFTIVDYFMEQNVTSKNKQMTVTVNEEHPAKEDKSGKPEVSVSENAEQTKSGNRKSEKLEEAAKDNMVGEDGPPLNQGKKKKKKKKKGSQKANPEKLSGVVNEQAETLSNKALDEFKKEMREMMETLSEKSLDELKKEMKEMKELREMREMIEQVMKQNSGKNEKKEQEKRIQLESWQRMRSALYRYDVSMEGIQAFQRFRFYCNSGYLPWPPSKQEYNEEA